MVKKRISNKGFSRDKETTAGNVEVLLKRYYDDDS